jgi:hypothetical protein
MFLQFASDQPATIGVDFKVKSIEVEGKKVNWRSFLWHERWQAWKDPCLCGHR